MWNGVKERRKAVCRLVCLVKGKEIDEEKEKMKVESERGLILE